MVCFFLWLACDRLVAGTSVTIHSPPPRNKKETHYFDDDHLNNCHPREKLSMKHACHLDAQRFTDMYRTKGWCRHSPTSPPHFYEGTPNNIFGYAGIETLVRSMPPAFLPQVRFVLILREPIARSLSAFNHQQVSE